MSVSLKNPNPEPTAPFSGPAAPNAPLSHGAPLSSKGGLPLEIRCTCVERGQYLPWRGVRAPRPLDPALGLAVGAPPPRSSPLPPAREPCR